MKEINTKDAVGHVLCHDITQIVKDKVKGVAFKKGHVVKEEDIEIAIKLTFSLITKEFEENTALYDIENGVYVDGQNKSEIDPIVRKLK